MHVFALCCLLLSPRERWWWGGIEMALSFHPSVHPLFRPSHFLKFLHIWRQRADWIEFRFDGWTHYEHPLTLWSCCAEFPSFPVIWLVEQFSYIHRQTTVQIGGWIYRGIPHVSLTFRHAPRNFQPLLALDLWSNFRTFTGVLLIKLAQIWWVKLLMGLCRSYQLWVTLRLIPVIFLYLISSAVFAHLHANALSAYLVGELITGLHGPDLHLVNSFPSSPVPWLLGHFLIQTCLLPCKILKQKWHDFKYRYTPESCSHNGAPFSNIF